MSRLATRSAVVWGCLALWSRPTAAQTAPSTDSTSTLTGVYTADQAKRGKVAYAGLCRSCHIPSTGDSFARLWGGRPVSDLFKYIMETMPDNNPGQISAADNADIVGYLLQVTGMPAGTRELSANVDSLKAIRIEMKRDASPPADAGRPRK